MPTVQPISPAAAVLKHKRAIQRRLLSWFDLKTRDLPWLVDRTPYRVWISEIMLQQTQISVVVEYYLRFIQAFPRQSRGSGVLSTLRQVRHFSRQLSQFPRESFSISGAS